LAKINKPLLSLSAIGALGKHLVFRRRGKGIVAQQTARPVDRRSFAQLQWRTLYQKAIALWHLLSPAEKEAWERQATPRHMTGFAYFISQALKPNPGIYLPLAGGTMQGDVDFDGHKILNLPAPTADEEPTRKVDLAAHAALVAAIHGLVGFNAFWLRLTSDQSISPSTITVIQLDNEIYDYGSHWDAGNYRLKPTIPSTWFICSVPFMIGLPAGKYVDVYFFKNGVLHVYGDRTFVPATANVMLPTSCLCAFNGSTDYLDIRIFHSNTSSLSLPRGNYRNFAMGFLIPQS